MFYTKFLDDNDSEERRLGMECGSLMLMRSDIVAVYADHGITAGMQGEIDLAARFKLKVDFRYILGRREK